MSMKSVRSLTEFSENVQMFEPGNDLIYFKIPLRKEMLNTKPNDEKQFYVKDRLGLNNF